jgi:hypothetical protein
MLLRYRPAACVQHALAGNVVRKLHEMTREPTLEYMVNTLRLRGGVVLARFGRCTGLPLPHVLTPLRQARQRGLVDGAAPPTSCGKRHGALTFCPICKRSCS